MQQTTTVRVLTETRDAVRRLADADGVTLDEEIRRLTRSERQRRMGQALAASTPDVDEQRWVDLGAEATGS